MPTWTRISWRMAAIDHLTSMGYDSFPATAIVDDYIDRFDYHPDPVPFTDNEPSAVMDRWMGGARFS